MDDAPPSYEEVTGRPTITNRPADHSRRLSRNMPSSDRRSMEDEARPLPFGWIRQFDPKEQHQFFVDTAKEPPRAIWAHPYDDDEYLATLSESERREIASLVRPTEESKSDIEADSTDDEEDDDAATDTKGRRTSRATSSAGAGPSSAAAARPSSSQHLAPPNSSGRSKPTLGRKMKDKLTGSTHEQREAKRRQRAEEERRIYEQHRLVRAAMARAMETGEPQLLGKDSQGKDVYIEPPSSSMRYSQYPGDGYGVNPARQGGPYANANARFIRPQQPYARPYGYGYGGGYGRYGGYGGYGYGARGYGGSGLGLPIAGGLAGGLLLGGLLGGF